MSKSIIQPESSEVTTGLHVGDRYPILRRLEDKLRRRQLPYVRQNSTVDCGPACLAALLEYLGHGASLESVRQACGAGRDGTSAFAITEAAAAFGLRGRGVSVDINDLPFLPTGSILHWGFNHFVLYERFRREHVDIMDPAHGARRVSMDEFNNMFTGVALVFEKTDRFHKESRRKPGLLGYLPRILAYRELLVRILIVSIVIQMCGLGLPLLTGLLVDRVIPHSDFNMLQIISLGLLLMMVCQLICSLMRAHLLLHLRTQLDAEMTLDFLDHLVALPYRYFQQRSPADLMMRLNSNSDVRETLTSTILTGLLDCSLVCGYLIVIFVAQPLFGMAVLLLGVLRVVIFTATRRRISQLTNESISAQVLSQGFQIQLLAGMETLKAMGAERRAVERWAGMFTDVLNVSLKRGRLNAWVQAASGGLSFVSPLAVLLLGGMLVMRGDLSVGAMLALSALAAGFLMPLGSLVSTGIGVQELGGHISRLDDVLSAEPEQDPRSEPASFRLRGRISLEGVTFRYSPHSTAAVHDISLEVEPGTMVAIVGRSAAGKSTLASLLMALYRPESGRILYDGRDLGSLDIRLVRQQIGIVPQQAFLFGASIRDNISLPNPKLSMEDVIRAAQLAHIHDDIMQMPMGYDTLLMDGGRVLSGGQRQRIAIARAIAGQPGILVLDEATSALDADTERHVQESIAGLDCTRIVIAHRLSTIRNADQIIVLEGGKIVDRGSHDRLVAISATYRGLLGRQL